MVSEFEVKEYCTLQTAIKQKKLQTMFGAFVLKAGLEPARTLLFTGF